MRVATVAASREALTARKSDPMNRKIQEAIREKNLLSLFTRNCKQEVKADMLVRTMRVSFKDPEVSSYVTAP